MVANLAVNDLFSVIPWMMLLRFEHSALWARVDQRNHLTMVAYCDPKIKNKHLSNIKIIH